MQKIVLSRGQLERIAMIQKEFEDVDQWSISSDSSNGIGPVIKLSCMILDQTPATFDLTEFDKW